MTTRFSSPVRRSKFGAEPTIVDGIRFASKAEARRYGELRRLERAGEISQLECQPKWKFSVNGVPVLIRSEGYPNGRQASFKADFRYFDAKDGRMVVEDVKGGRATRTEAYALRKALLEAMHPTIRVVEVTR